MKKIIAYEISFDQALEVEPVNFYFDYSQIKDKINDIFLYMKNGVIVGAVSCYGN